MNSNMRMNSRFKICNSLKKTECLILLKEYLDYDELKKAIEPTQEQIYKLMNAFTKSDLQNIVYNTQSISTDLLIEEINLKEECGSDEEEIIVVKKPAESKQKTEPKQKTDLTQKSDIKKITINDNSIKQEEEIKLDFIEVMPTESKNSEEDYLKIANELNKIKTYKNIVLKVKEDKIPKHIYDRYFAELKPQMIKKANKIKAGDYEALSIKDLYELMELCN